MLQAAPSRACRRLRKLGAATGALAALYLVALVRTFGRQSQAQEAALACPWLVPATPRGFFDHELFLNASHGTDSAAVALHTLLGAAFCCGKRVRIIIRGHWPWRDGDWCFDFQAGVTGTNCSTHVVGEAPTDLWPWFYGRFVDKRDDSRDACLQNFVAPDACLRALLQPSLFAPCSGVQPRPGDLPADDSGPSRFLIAADDDSWYYPDQGPPPLEVYERALEAERQWSGSGEYALRFESVSLSSDPEVLRQFRCATAWVLTGSPASALLLAVLDPAVTRRVYDRGGCRSLWLCSRGVRVLAPPPPLLSGGSRDGPPLSGGWA